MKKIGLAQMNIEYGNYQRNCKTAEIFIQNAIDQNCDLILLPELWSTGFDYHHMETFALENIDLINQIQVLSDSAKICVCGTFIENISGHFYNSFKLIQPKIPVETYSKHHLFQLMREDQHFTPGEASVPVQSILGSTGLAICFDLRFPDMFWDLSSKGVETFLISSHWPLARIHHWDTLLRARAIENQAFVIAVNSVGQSGKDLYGGHSTIISPDGEILLQAPSDQENLFTLEIDPDAVKHIRKNFEIRR
jgi:omega-amidase